MNTIHVKKKYLFIKYTGFGFYFKLTKAIGQCKYLKTTGFVWIISSLLWLESILVQRSLIFDRTIVFFSVCLTGKTSGRFRCKIEVFLAVILPYMKIVELYGNLSTLHCINDWTSSNALNLSSPKASFVWWFPIIMPYWTINIMHKGYRSWELSLSGYTVIIIMVSLEYLR